VKQELQFEAEIKANPGTSGGTFIEFPFDTEKVFGRGGRIKVLCSFDGIEYRGSLVRMGTLCHIIGLRKDIMAALGKKPGERVQVRISEDVEERVVAVPTALREALEKTGLLDAFKALSYTRQKEYAMLISSAKKEETRHNRLTRIVEEELGSKAPSESPIEAYIQGFEGIKRVKLEEIHALIREEASGATEKMSYGMPTFYLYENLVHFATQAKHMGFYPTPSGITAFEAELGSYRYSKGAIQFPYDEPLPKALIRKVVRFRLSEAGIAGFSSEEDVVAYIKKLRTQDGENN